MGLACFLVLLSAARAAQDAVNLGKDVVKDFQQCDRDCRWVYGFYEKDITGTRVNADGSEDEWFGEHCLCSRAGRPLMEPNLIRRSVKKTWDDRFWCGDFQTSNVCAMSLSTGEVGTTTRQAAAANESELHVLHCGACGACSQPDDLMVLHDTKTFITTKMTKCSIKFSMPEILGARMTSTRSPSACATRGLPLTRPTASGGTQGFKRVGLGSAAWTAGLTTSSATRCTASSTASESSSTQTTTGSTR